jgi:DNA-binding transcriptional LysR family regulator
LKEMLGADGLLIFQASNCNLQVPAKIYEYLRARKPVFAMTDPDGDTAAVLRGAGIGTIASLGSKEQMVEGLQNFLEQVRRRQAPVPRTEDLRVYSRKSRTSELAALLDGLKDHHREEDRHA